MMSIKKETRDADISELHNLLQDALEVEHATIPPYFTAWLSMKEECNYEPREIVRSVLIEEMLHMTLVANLMNAVNAKPDLTHSTFVPRYPHILPHSGAHYKIHIRKFSKAALHTFLDIEKPEEKGTKPKGEKFLTIGQFYAYVRNKINYLCDTYGEETIFCGTIEKQIRPEDYYGSGAVIIVKDRTSAHQALNEIVEQGEGAHEGIFDKDHNILGPGAGNELAHYYRFHEILAQKHYVEGNTPDSGPTGDALKVDYDKVYNLETDTDRTKYPAGSDKRQALNAFADSYGQLLTSLENAFNGNRSQLTEGMARMFALRNQGLAIIQTPKDNNGKENMGLDFTPN